MGTNTQPETAPSIKSELIEPLEAAACTWARAFDGHFNISCPSGERANGQFKPDNNYQTKWNFKFCPYCGRPIELSP